MKLRPLMIETMLSNKVYFHGTNKDFDGFKYNDSTGLGGDMLGKGIYVTDNLEYAKEFGSRINKCKVKANSPIDLTKAKEGMFDKFLPFIKDEEDIEKINSCLRMRALNSAFRIIRKYVSMEDMQKLGYDCVLSWADHEKGGTEIAIFNPNDLEIV